MNATITQVFEACCLEIGFPFNPRHRRIPCPFHRGIGYTLGMHDDGGYWKCFVGSCPSPKGKIFDVPIAFGLAGDRSEASRWLASRNLIPPAEKKPDQPRGVVSQKKRKIYPHELPELQRSVWREAQIELQQTIGLTKWRELRERNFGYHYRRYHQLLKRHEDGARLIVRLAYDLPDPIELIKDLNSGLKKAS